MHSVLVVEDDHNIRVTLRNALEAEGYFIFSAANGIDGLAMLQRIKPPMAILLDQTMPLMNGEQFLKIKDSDSSLSIIPVLIISAIEKHCHSESVKGFIRKPIDLDKLYAALSKLTPP